MFCITVFAQLLQDGGYYFSDLNPDEIQIIIPEGDIFVESTPIENVIEGVGSISYTSVPLYSAPSKKARESKIIRYISPSDKLVITAGDDDWYAVRTYDGKEGFVERRNVKTGKVFYDESVTANNMDKRLNYELKELVRKFNDSISDSKYMEKYRIVPRLTITSTSKRNNRMVINIEYSAVDINGSVIPSKQNNTLDDDMKKFIELLFVKMLPSKAVDYKIIIKKPVFAANGRVLNTQGEYAELHLTYEGIDSNQVKGAYVNISGKIKVKLDGIETNMEKCKLFQKYPY